MNKFFETFYNIRQYLDASPDFWEEFSDPLRIFISLENQEDGVHIDTNKKLISFPVKVRDNVSSINLIFDKDALDLYLLGEVSLSQVLEHNKIRVFGDPLLAFSASVFLNKLFKAANKIINKKTVKDDSYNIH